VDVLDYHRDRLSARRLRVLIQRLTEHLLAAAVDELAVGNWLFASAHTPENGDPPERPRQIPRPGVQDEGEAEPVSATPGQIAAFFGAAPEKGSP
jgi:hypothetical protein